MRLSKRQLKRIIREEYTRLKRRGLLKENKIAPLVGDFMYADQWYEFMYTGLDGSGMIKGSELDLYNEQDLINFGFDPATVEGMMADRMEFEEHCQEELGMRLSRCWDLFFAEMDRQEAEGHIG